MLKPKPIDPESHTHTNHEATVRPTASLSTGFIYFFRKQFPQIRLIFLSRVLLQSNLVIHLALVIPKSIQNTNSFLNEKFLLKNMSCVFLPSKQRVTLRVHKLNATGVKVKLDSTEHIAISFLFSLPNSE